MVISSTSDTLCITLSDRSLEITTNSASLIPGAFAGIGTYLGGGFEVYGSEGLYITCDGATTISSQDRLTIKAEEISMQSTAEEQYLKINWTDTDLTIFADTNNLTLSIWNDFHLIFENEMYINSHLIDFPVGDRCIYSFPEKSGHIATIEDLNDLPTFETISAMAEGGGPTTVELGKTKSGRLAFWINGSSNDELPFEILDSRGISIYEFAVGERDEDEFLFEMFWYGVDVFFSAGGRRSHVDYGNYLTSIKIDMTGNRSSVVIYCSGYVMR